MRFNINKSELLNALTIVSKGTASRSTIPVLSGVYIKAEGMGLVMETTDLERSIRYSVPALVEEEGTTVIPEKLLLDIVKNLPEAAVEFQNKHPNETLILVTADHETGGMAIGYKTTNYDTFLTNLAHQKMSYAKFDSTYVQNYIANKTPFEAAMQDVKANFGLTLPSDPDAANAGKLLLTDYEVQNLRTAYERTLKVGSASQKEMSQQDYELYGTYIPFSMAICHTINHKSGMDHTTYAHTGAMVNVYANGVGAEKFGGVFDNTEIYHKLADLTKVK